MEYKTLLDAYFSLISSENWADGRREELVRKMDRVWEKMKREEREASLRYADQLYQNRIK